MSDFTKIEPPKSGSTQILSYKPKEIAFHLTLLEFKIFQSINRTEFYNRGWMKANKETNSPNITNMIKRSSEVQFYLCFLKQIGHFVGCYPNRQPKISRNALQNCGKTCYDWTCKLCCMNSDSSKWCKKFNNLNTVVEIVCGLNMWIVRRLLKDWKVIFWLVIFLQLDAKEIPHNLFIFKKFGGTKAKLFVL
jgi:hypothetical protein